MDLWLIWIVLGFVLVIVELLTGTFYLLAIAAGVFAASLVAYTGLDVLPQAFIGSAVAVAGSVYVHHWHSAQNKTEPGQANFLDRGQPVVLESWVDEATGLARVKYRGTSWDAKIANSTVRPSPGTLLYIDSQDAGVLVVGPTPPAR